MASLRILLVEDHPVMQQAMQTILSAHGTIVATLDRVDALASTIRETNPQVLVLDVSLPGRSGMQVLPETRRDSPWLGIVIATNHGESIYRLEALKRGADAFVTKDRLLEDLLPAIQEAYSARQIESLRRSGERA